MRKNLLSISKVLSFALVLATILQACVSIETTSYSDPDFIAKKYNKICVYSVDQNFNKRELIEKVFVREFMDQGYYAVQGSKLFPPTREWSESDFQSILSKEGFDGFLKVEILDEVVNERVTPQFHTNTSTTTKKKKNGKEETITQTNSYVTEDRDVFMNNQFQADMIDVATNKIAWKGFSSTEAQINMIGIDITVIIEKFAEDVLSEMQKKNHLVKNN